MKALLDTSILVDLLRSFPPAVAWLQQASDNQLGVPAAVWLELIDGARNLEAQRKALRLLRRFERISMTPQDTDWAIDKALRFRLSHSVDILDCLIAAPSHRLQLPLYTRNLKHFQPMIGDEARAPYRRDQPTAKGLEP